MGRRLTDLALRRYCQVARTLSTEFAGSFVRHTRAFIWINRTGGVFLDKYLANHGVVVPVGWSLSVANVISADGKTIYGWGFNPDSLIEMYKVAVLD